MSNRACRFRSVVLLALGAPGLFAPQALAQRAVAPQPIGPGQPAPPPGYQTFNPSATAPGGPGPGSATLGQNAPPPPSYVGGGGYSGPSTVVAPSYGAYIGNPVGGYLSGAADLTAATGQYWKDIQSARMSREQANQMAIDTRSKQLQAQLEYEKYRPTAAKMMKKEKETDLEWARKYAQNTEIWSGRTLNILYDSAIRSNRISMGPNIPVENNILSGLNLTDQTSRGNGGLMKEQRLFWPQTLDSEAYDQRRNQFTKDWELANKQVAMTGVVDRKTLGDLETDLLGLSSQLDDAVRDLSPTRYIESRRYINQLKDGVKALEETRRGKPVAYQLVGQVRNVAEVCAYLAKKGLKFAPATARNDEVAYSAFYLLLRAFEMSIVGEQ
jgi:hypothetical protein